MNSIMGSVVRSIKKQCYTKKNIFHFISRNGLCYLLLGEYLVNMKYGLLLNENSRIGIDGDAANKCLKSYYLHDMFKNKKVNR